MHREARQQQYKHVYIPPNERYEGRHLKVTSVVHRRQYQPDHAPAQNGLEASQHDERKWDPEGKSIEPSALLPHDQGVDGRGQVKGRVDDQRPEGGEAPYVGIAGPPGPR